ncbi:hypothetical protein Q3G72_005887 [Acer saccharum]|nr:hypothetical protein Q3G72_005887 [Acer saccharum]
MAQSTTTTLQAQSKHFWVKALLGIEETEEKSFLTLKALFDRNHHHSSASACREDRCCHREESSTSKSSTRPRQPLHRLNLVNFLTVSISPRASIDTDIADMILFTNPDSICVELLMELPNKPKKPADIFPFQQRGKRLCWRRGQAPTTSPLLL